MSLYGVVPGLFFRIANPGTAFSIADSIGDSAIALNTLRALVSRLTGGREQSKEVLGESHEG